MILKYALLINFKGYVSSFYNYDSINMPHYPIFVDKNAIIASIVIEMYDNL